MQNKITVVMATYNGEKYILQQLDSIKNQFLPPNEVIISDDGSMDDTVAIVENYIQQNALRNWNIIKNKRSRGFYNNFFNALEHASGNIIFLADQDDVWDLQKIKEFIKIYDNNDNVMMIQSNVQFINDENLIIDSHKKYHYKLLHNSYEELTLEDMCRFAGSGYTMSFRRSVLDDIFTNGFDRERDTFEYHDVLIGLMAIGKGKCLLSKDIIDKHRLHSNNVTQAKGKSYLFERTKDRQCEILKKRTSIFKLLSSNCGTELTRNYFENCSCFAGLRLELIEKFSLLKMCRLIQSRNLYASKKGLISDCLYALGGEKLLLAIYSKI